MGRVGPHRGVATRAGAVFRAALGGTRTRASNRCDAPNLSRRPRSWPHRRTGGEGYRGTSGRPGCDDRRARRAEWDGGPPRGGGQRKTRALRGKQMREAAKALRRERWPVLPVPTSSKWMSRWQPAEPEPRRCTRTNASPFSGTKVANSPAGPLGGDKVDLVSSCQKEHAASNPSDWRSINPVSQRTAPGGG